MELAVPRLTQSRIRFSPKLLANFTEKPGFIPIKLRQITSVKLCKKDVNEVKAHTIKQSTQSLPCLYAQ